MKKSPDINYVLEVFWLIMASVTLIMGIYALFRNGLRTAYPFFIMTVLSLLIYLARRTLRRKNSARINE
jgi:hypothetical protein